MESKNMTKEQKTNNDTVKSYKKHENEIFSFIPKGEYVFHRKIHLHSTCSSLLGRKPPCDSINGKHLQILSSTGMGLTKVFGHWLQFIRGIYFSRYPNIMRCSCMQTPSSRVDIPMYVSPQGQEIWYITCSILQLIKCTILKFSALTWIPENIIADHVLASKQPPQGREPQVLDHQKYT